MTTATTTQVRIHNRHQVLGLLYRDGAASKRDIARTLGMSLPTVTQNLHELELQGLVRPAGFLDSTGGRKARLYTFDAQARLAIGIQLDQRGITACAVNLRGECTAKAIGKLQYADTPAYRRRVGQFANRFADSLPEAKDGILGIAFCAPSILPPTSAGATRVSPVPAYGGQFDVPVRVVSAADAAALAELWVDPHIHDAICLYLDDHVSGALVMDGRPRRARTPYGTGIGHMTLVRDGHPCVCGRYGCVDAYCSAEALTGERRETLERFFTLVRDDDYAHRRAFNTYLDNLAAAIRNICAVFDGDIILGGRVGRHLSVDDLNDLAERIRRLEPFPGTGHVLRRSVCTRDQAAVGAALTYVDAFVRPMSESHATSATVELA